LNVPQFKQIPGIDGLRAIAILSVVLFHAGIPGLAGGYVGVDVFFVISGFLITRLLVSEVIQTGTIDILNFYAGRVRRLLPALALVLLVTIAAGAIVLSPIGEQQDLAASALATVTFLSNVFFWRTQTGYFAGPADQLPLLHTWTLAVEEQFYIFWPVAILAATVLARRLGTSLWMLLVPFVLAGGLSSFLLSWLITPTRETMAFYLTPFRAWELGIGGLLSIYWTYQGVNPAAHLVGSALGFLGLAAILAASVLFDLNTVFPGIAAGLPAVGAGSVILGVMLATESPVARLLSATPLVFVGKLSYSWYLWHWPLLATARAWSLGGHSLWRDLGLVLVGLVLSAATYCFVEQPVREKKPWPFALRGQAIAAGLLILLLGGVLSSALWISANAASHHDEFLAALKEAKSKTTPILPKCTNFQHPFGSLAPMEECIIGNAGHKLLVLWGDSHAYHLIPALVQQTTLRGMRLLPRTMGGCKPYILSPNDVKESGINRLYEADCVRFNNEVHSSLAELKNSTHPVVMLAARWVVPSVWERSGQNWSKELAGLVGELRATGLDVVMAADVPEFAKSVPQCLARLNEDLCSRGRDEVDRERAVALSNLRRIAEQFDHVVLWDPIDELCTQSRCKVIQGSTVLYSDEQHLSELGALRLSRSIGQALDTLEAAKRPAGRGIDAIHPQSSGLAPPGKNAD
jgi:peptidoglycan/LPS O-acetylase OafA/YrhL